MKEILQYQYKNLFLWAPFVTAFGAALYFSLGSEPNFHFPIIITALICGIFYKYKNIFVRAFALFLFGFFYAMSFTHIIDTPQIKDSFDFVSVNGIVKDVDFTSDSTRILLSINAQQIDKDLPNKNLNIRVSLKENIPDIGDTINGDIKIFHPSPKYTPGSFDFARWAYFSKISGTGFFKKYDITKSKSSNTVRTTIHDKANSVLTDALVLGYKKVIPESQSFIWKSVGVGHVWSISGFHMTLIGGWLFALFYLLFRSIPYVTKRIPAKYPAIICAWFGLICYLYISGISIATTRAFLMASLVFAATLLGRGVLSLRNAALAFLIIFLINPYAVMNAGFQLSFAAIFGLIWFFDDKQYIKRTYIKRILHYAGLLFTTAFIATVFTLPFIIAHFGYIPLYSLIGNIILLPIFSIAIMPMVLIGTIFTLFGNHFILHLTNNVYDFALSVANHISNLPYANLLTPNMSNTVLICIIVGFLFLTLIVKPDSKKFFIKNINYILCVFCISIGITIYASQQKPLFYATEDHELVAFNVNNKLQFNKSRASHHYFAFNSWYQHNNEVQPDKNKRYKCDHGFCVYKTPKWNLVYMQNFTAILNNIESVCADKNIDYIVTTFETKSQNCYGKILDNGLMIYPNGKVKEIINQRPWHNLH
jgi:competence protein ComEC